MELVSNTRQGARGKGTKHIVYWRLPSGGNEGQPLKVNLVVFENDTMQVAFDFL